MKWFHHETGSRADWKLRRLVAEHGMLGYGVYWAVVELLAQQHDEESDGHVEIDLTKYPVNCLAQDLGMDAKTLEPILVLMAEVGLVDTDCWSRKVLCCKALRKRADDYFKRKANKKNRVRTILGVSSKSVRTMSEHSSRKVKESKVEKNKEKLDTGEARGVLLAFKAKLETIWSEAGLPKILKWNDDRILKLAGRVKEPMFVENFEVVIEKMKVSSFLTGSGNRGWKADIDWLLANDSNYVRVLEGKYDDQASDVDSKYYKKEVRR